MPVEQSIRFVETIKSKVGEEWVKFYLTKDVLHHGKGWWHEEWVANMCFDYLDEVLMK